MEAETAVVPDPVAPVAITESETPNMDAGDKSDLIETPVTSTGDAVNGNAVISSESSKDQSVGDEGVVAVTGEVESKIDEDAAKPARTSGRVQRVRKSVDAFDPTNVKEKKELVIPDGKGERLEDMPRVVANFKDITWSDPHLKMLHMLVFGRGQKKEFKSHLLKFNGLVYPEGKEEDEKEKIKLKMYKIQLPDLKEVMDLCDIDRSAESFGRKNPDKEMLCNRLLEWLEHPVSSGKKIKASKTSSKKSPPAKSDSVKKRGRPTKLSGTKQKPPAKKGKRDAVKGDIIEDDNNEIDFNIPGTTIEKVRAKVKSIVDNANREELTVKGVRQMLEEWLDTDLSDYKNAVRALVMEAM